MVTHWIVFILSMMFLIAAQEVGGSVMMTISLKLVIYQMGFIIQRLTNIPLNKMCRLRKSATLTCIYGTMYFEFDYNPPYSNKICHF